MADVPKSIKASLYIDGKPAEASLKNIKQATLALRREFESLTVGTEEYNRKMRELQVHERTLRNIQDEVKGVGGAFGWLRTELGKLGAVAVGVLGFQFVTEQFHNIIMTNAKLSDSLADVRRVAGLTELEVLNLNKALKGIDTRTSIAGLRDIAVIGGKLGVAKDDLVGFTEAVDKLVVTLGDELGNADQITTQLGKILNVFEGKVTGDNITKLGNAMVVLANAGVASGGFIADFVQRVSSIAVSAHLSLGATVGLAAGLEELGQKAESSSTAITRLLTDIASDLPKAASIAKIPLEQFTKLFGETPEKALLAYASGLVKNKSAFNEIAASFKDAGEEGQRVIGTLASLGNKAEFMQGKIDLGNKSLLDTAAINEGFALKNETFGATIDKLGKKFNELSLNKGLTGLLQNLVFLTSAAIDGFNKHAAAIASMTKIIIVAGVAWATYKIYLAAANSQTLGFIVNLVTGNKVIALNRTATIALAGTQALFAGNMAKVTQAARLLNITLLENPIGIVIAAVLAAVAAVYLFKNSVNDVIEAQKELTSIQNKAADKIGEEKDKIEALTKIATDLNAVYSDRIDAIKLLRSLIPDHLKAYTDEQILAGKAAGAIDEYVKSLTKKAEAEVAYDELKRLKAERRTIESGDGDLNFAQGVGQVVTDIFTGIDNGQKHLEKTMADNKLNALRTNKAQIDAIEAKYRVDIKNQLLEKPTTGGEPSGPAKRSVDDIEKEIAGLQKEQKAVASTSAEWKKYEQQIKKLEDEEERITGKKSGSGQADSIIQRSRSVTQAVKEFNAQQLADQQNKNQKELDSIANRYDKEIAKVKDIEAKIRSSKALSNAQKKTELAKHEDEIAQLQKDKEASANATRERQERDLLQRIRDLRVSLGEIYQAELDKEKERINNFYNDQLADGNNKDIVEAARAKDLADAKIREQKRFQDAVEEINEQGVVTEAQREKLRKAQINKKYDDEIEALKKKFSAELQATKEFQAAIDLINKNRENELRQKTQVSQQEINKALLDTAIQGANDIANGIADIGRQNRQAEADAQIKKLEDQKDAELSNKDLTEEQRTAITNKYAKEEAAIKLQQWEADKQASLEQAEINTALAITKALTSAPWPLNLISAAGAAAAGGMQIASIAKSKPPQFADGGLTDKDPAGYVGQPTIFKNSASGRPFVAGEAGREWIAPNWMLKSPRYANIIGMLESARQEKRAYAAGGFNGSSSSQPAMPAYDNSELLAEMQLMRKAIKDQKVLISYQYWKQEMDKIAQIETISNAG